MAKATLSMPPSPHPSPLFQNVTIRRGGPGKKQDSSNGIHTPCSHCRDRSPRFYVGRTCFCFICFVWFCERVAVLCFCRRPVSTVDLLSQETASTHKFTERGLKLSHHGPTRRTVSLSHRASRRGTPAYLVAVPLRKTTTLTLHL